MSYTAIIAIFVGNKLTKRFINNISNDYFLSKKLSKRPVYIDICNHMAFCRFRYFFFYQISLYSIFVNIIAIPLAGVLIPITLIAGILGCIYEPLGIFFVGTSDMILNIYDIICNFFLSLPFSVVIVGAY